MNDELIPKVESIINRALRTFMAEDVVPKVELMFNNRDCALKALMTDVLRTYMSEEFVPKMEKIPDVHNEQKGGVKRRKAKAVVQVATNSLQAHAFDKLKIPRGRAFVSFVNLLEEDAAKDLKPFTDAIDELKSKLPLRGASAALNKRVKQVEGTDASSLEKLLSLVGLFDKKRDENCGGEDESTHAGTALADALDSLHLQHSELLKLVQKIAENGHPRAHILQKLEQFAAALPEEPALRERKLQALVAEDKFGKIAATHPSEALNILLGQAELGMLYGDLKASSLDEEDDLPLAKKSKRKPEGAAA